MASQVVPALLPVVIREAALESSHPAANDLLVRWAETLKEGVLLDEDPKHLDGASAIAAWFLLRLPVRHRYMARGSSM